VPWVGFTWYDSWEVWPALLTRVMNRLRLGMPRIAFECRLWRLISRTSGPIDPSDLNLIHSIKTTFPWSISFIQVVLAAEEVRWTGGMPRGKCGRTCMAGRA
jgi:hypothetical protein